MSDQYNILLQKLDTFIRKFYKNQLIKGAIYCFSLLIIFFLLANLLEYFGQFNSNTRTVIFYIYVLLNALLIGWYVVYPLLKLYKIGNRISNEQAAEIIGDHFANIRDKLLNTLQLKELTKTQVSNLELINAGIDQKISDLKPVPFVKAVDFATNRKYLKYAFPPLFILIILLLSSPKILTETTNRLVRHNLYFEKVFPFTISILNDKLEVIQHEDLKLKVKISGDEIPESVFLETGNNRIKLIKENPIHFSHTFINVQNSTTFSLTADKYKSDVYEIKVLPKPIMLDFEISLDYPAYTGKKDEVITKNGDLIIPMGTNIGWTFYTRNTDEIRLEFKDQNITLKPNESNIFKYDNTFSESQQYIINSSNEFLENLDSLTYTINIIPDLFPAILVEEYQDSMYDGRLYFKGAIKDDYGFDLLTFNCKVIDIDNQDENSYCDSLNIVNQVNPQQFFHFYDLANLKLNAGNTVEYYFEVWDNDRIHGSKSTRSQIMSYKLPSIKEIDELTKEKNQLIKNEMDDAIKEAKQLQKEIEQLSKKMVDKKDLNWEDQQQIQTLLEKQQELQNKLEKIKRENEKKALKEQQYKEKNEELLAKQKQLEELFEKLMQNEELNKLFEELQKLMDEVDKEKVSEMLEKMQMSAEEMEKMLDRNLELFKQFEFETKLEETIEKLEKLAEDQEQLSEETLDRENTEESLKSEQGNIDKKFDEVKKDLEDLEKMNNELEDPNTFDEMQEEQSEIDDDLQESQDALEKGQRKKASKSQKSSSGKMSKMASDLLSMQQDMIQEGMEEDIDALRDILENLIQLSFDQEDLIMKVSNVNLSDPKYIELIQEQKKIKDDLKTTEDSLVALSKRQIMIEPFVTKELNSINQNIDKSISYLNNRQTPQASSRQQYVMTSVNNLALMLSETLNQMIQSMMQQSSGNKSCKNGKPKPGSGSPSMKSMRQLQEQLSKQIEQLKSGKKDGGKDKGGQSSKYGQSMNEQLARMAAEQEAIRNQMNQFSKQLEKEGQFGASKEIKKIMEEMEKTETDLVNKMVTQETLLRQKEIETRMLRSERAEMEREKEEKRESTEAKNQKYRNPEEYFKYNRQQINEVELLKTMPPNLKPFYKNKVNQYFYNFEELLDK